MEEQIEDLKLKVEKLSEEAEFNFQKGDHYKPRVTEYLKQIDEMLGDENANSKPHLRPSPQKVQGRALLSEGQGFRHTSRVLQAGRGSLDKSCNF